MNYREFDIGLLTIHHGADEGSPSATQGLRIQRSSTQEKWTQHIQSNGSLGFYYAGRGGSKMRLDPSGNLFVTAVNPSSDINLKEKNN